MPITITFPESDDAPFGWGFFFRASTDLIGPIPTSYRWLVSITDRSEAENKFFTQSFPLQSAADHVVIGTYGITTPTGLSVGRPATNFAHGKPGRIRVELQDASNTIIDHGSRDIIQDFVSGQAYIQQIGIQSQAGFNATDRSILEQVPEILSGITANFGGAITRTLGSFFLHPPTSVLVRELIGDFSGQAAFQRTAPGVGVNAYGITWQVQSYGGGIGVDPSTPPRFETRLLEIEVIHELADGQELTSDIHSIDYSNGLVLFDHAFPERIQVDIAPSVTIRFWWLLVGL